VVSDNQAFLFSGQAKAEKINQGIVACTTTLNRINFDPDSQIAESKNLATKNFIVGRKNHACTWSKGVLFVTGGMN
jgi:hypothetical protein